MEKNFDNEVYTLCYNSLDVFKNKKDAITYYYARHFRSNPRAVVHKAAKYAA